MNVTGVNLSFPQHHGFQKKKATVTHDVGGSVYVTVVDHVVSINDVGSGLICIKGGDHGLTMFPASSIYSMEVK